MTIQHPDSPDEDEDADAAGAVVPAGDAPADATTGAAAAPRRRKGSARALAPEPEAAPAGPGLTDDDRALAILEAAETAVANLQSLEQAVVAVRQVDAARVIARRAIRSRELHGRCFSMMVAAQRAGGMMLRESERARGGRPNLCASVTGFPTLDELGISRRESSVWQRLAAVPESSLREYITQSLAEGRDLTTTGVLRLAKETNEAGQPTVSAPPRAPRTVEVSVVEVSAGETAAPPAPDELITQPRALARRTTRDPRDDQDIDIVPVEAARPCHGSETAEVAHVVEDSPVADVTDESSATRRGSHLEDAALASGRSAPREHHAEQFCALMQQGRWLTRWLDLPGLRVAANEAESLAQDLAITLQARREEEPSNLADGDFDEAGDCEWEAVP